MDKNRKIGFEMEGMTLPIDRILPVKQITKSMKESNKYFSVLASIREVGVIEPPIVYPAKGNDGGDQQYLLLDGHIRISALRRLGHKSVFCLISTDDESYTYNHKVNRLAPIQEHFMIVKAIEKGVSEERIAKTLDVDVASIRKKRNLLDGICPEAVALLKDKEIAPGALAFLKKVKPIRQIEMAELMNSVNNFHKLYVQALVAATDKELFVDAREDKEKLGVRPEDMARMEKEMKTLERDFKEMEDGYGNNMMNLVLARGYLNKILNNGRVVRFLSSNYSDILAELQKILDMTSDDA